MTVGDLIDALNKFPKDMKIVFLSQTTDEGRVPAGIFKERWVLTNTVEDVSAHMHVSRHGKVPRVEIKTRMISRPGGKI